MTRERSYIVILGAGGFSAEIIWLIDDINKKEKLFEIIGLVDEDLTKKMKKISGYNILGDFDWFIKNNDKNIRVVCAVSNPFLKMKLIQKAQHYNIKTCSLIHPSAQISDSLRHGEGCVITAGCILTTNVNLGDFVTINLSSTVGHDATIGNYSTIEPNVAISGKVIMEERVEIGTGAIVLPGKRIGRGSVICAGSVVNKDVESGKIVAGNPARVVRTNETTS